MKPWRVVRTMVFAVALMTLIAAWVGPANAQEGLADVYGSGGPYFVGGEWSWHMDIWAPEGSWSVAAYFDWGDGTADFADPGELNGEDGMYWIDWNHTWGEQGFYTLQAFVSIDENPWEPVWSDTIAVYDLNAGGTVTGNGTVWVPASHGGMYDSDFTGGPASFNLTAKRRSGTTATNVNLTVSVPSMTPDSGGSGMTFHGTAAVLPLYTDSVGTKEVWLGRVYGTVTKRGGAAAGTAFATFHAIVQRGQPTLVRIYIQNSGVGYTYMDSGFLDNSPYLLDVVHDRLLTGSIKIG